jgi:hypothetical protein
MAQLRSLAELYQQALDGLGARSSSAASDAAGFALYGAIASAGDIDVTRGLHGMNWKAVEPIILHTKVSASIVAYLGRTKWAAFKLDLLCDDVEVPPTSFQLSCSILGLLFASAIESVPCGSANSSVAAHMLKQVQPQPPVRALSIKPSAGSPITMKIYH